MKRSTIYIIGLYAVSLLYVLFQGGKTAIMLFIILNVLFIYLALGRLSGIYRVKGKHTVKMEGEEIKQPNVRAGSVLELELNIHIPGYYPLTYVIVRDYLMRHDGQHFMFEASYLPSWRKDGKISYQSPQLKRGGYKLEKTECLTYDVFGLLEHKGQFSSSNEISVMPQTVPLRSWDQLFKAQQGGYAHAVTTRSAKESTQINGIREYLPGDRLSRVHWNATARTGEWKSKAFEKESLPHMLVILDCAKSSYEQNGDDFELAVSTAASLLESGLRSGTAMGLLTLCDEPKFFEPRADASQRSVLLNHLTYAESNGTKSIQDMLAYSEPMLSRGGIALVVTASSPLQTSAALEFLRRKELYPYLFRIGAAYSETSVRSYGMKWPVFAINKLQELPAVLEGGSRR